MADSPDLTAYVDLRIYDRDLVDIQDAAVQDLQSRLDGWVPREDSTEMMLLEGVALEVSEAIFAINRLPSAIVQVLLQMYGVERDEGAPPVATVEFYVVDSFGYVVPAGTRMMLDLPGDLGPIVFATDAAVAIPNGDLTAQVTVTAEQFTSRANGVGAGTELLMIDSVNFVESVTLVTPISGGRSTETDQSWLTRGTQRFARLNDTLVSPKHFVAAALEKTYIERAYAVDLYDPTSGNNPGDDPGHMTLAVYGNGAPLDAGQKTDLYNELSQQAAANLQLHIVDPTINDVDVSITVVKFADADTSAVQSAIELALQQYLNPATWDWSGTVRPNEIIALVSNIPGVDYVQSITTPATPLVLTGVAPLAQADDITVAIS